MTPASFIRLGMFEYGLSEASLPIGRADSKHGERRDTVGHENFLQKRKLGTRHSLAPVSKHEICLDKRPLVGLPRPKGGIEAVIRLLDTSRGVWAKGAQYQAKRVLRAELLAILADGGSGLW